MNQLPETPEAVRILSPRILREHAQWMGRLVSRLVRDADRVDDVVQDAWAAALTNPAPEGTPLRAWLTGIAKRTALAHRRGETRRRDRETDRAEAAVRSGDGAERDVAELAACADEQRFLLEALTELPESQRAVLLLRFYEDLPPREIAARLDVPVNTVRTRQRLGLQRLHAALDERHGGRSSAWATALLPLAGPAGRAVVSGAGAASAGSGAAKAWLGSRSLQLLLAVTALAVVGGTAWTLLRDRGPESFQRAATVDETLAVLRTRQARSDLPLADVDLADLEAGRTEVAPDPASLLRGRVVDPGGNPIADARIVDAATPRPNVVIAGSSSSRSAPIASTDDQGLFEFGGAEDEGERWVTVQRSGYLHRVQAARLLPGEEAVLVMAPVAQSTLEIEVVDAQTGDRCMRFRARAFQWQDRVGPDVPAPAVHSASGTTTTGLVRLDVDFAVDRPTFVAIDDAAGVPVVMPAEVRLELLRREIEPNPDGSTPVRFEVDLDEPEQSGRYPVARGRVVDDMTGEPIPGARIESETIFPPAEELTDEERRQRPGWMPAPRERVVASDPEGTFAVAHPVGSTAARAVVTHEKYVAAKVELSSDPAADHVVRLQRRGRLTGVVLDGEGRPVPEAPLLVMKPGDERRPDRVRLTCDSEGRFTLEDALGGRYLIFVVRYPGGSDDDALTSKSVTLADGVDRSVILRISPPEGVHVKGEVLDMNGARVDLLPVYIPYADEGRIAEARATAAGFDAGALERGRYLVALVPPADDVETRPLFLPDVDVEGLATQRMTLRVPSARVTGSIDGLPASELAVACIPLGVTGFAADVLSQLNLESETHFEVRDGAFEARGLADGAHRLELRDAGSREVLSTRSIVVSGSLDVGVWRASE
ncbi:MAG: sigma-70 family RNA polymerase sigma factor [Planctomycetota bacterium]